MSVQEERRTLGQQRISVQALVDVCGMDGVRAFEAESCDLSRTGMHLSTAYLPEVGAQVVSRFEIDGEEVIVEGEVAWVTPQVKGGDFGIRFTGLDAESAQVLARLCEDTKVTETEHTPGGHPACLGEPGTRVMLHIDGLSAPMRARVDRGEDDTVRVGSSLEFLRLGRRLEVESLADGAKREARIEGIDVIIDPSTGVPRLLVVLDTRLEREVSPSAMPRVSRVAARGESRAERPPVAPSDEHADPEFVESVRAMRGRESQLFSAVTRGITDTGSRAMGGLSALLGGLGAQISSRFRSGTVEEPVRRRTSPPPKPATAVSARMGSSARRTPSEAVQQPKAADSQGTRRWVRPAIAAGVLAIVVGGGVALGGGNTSPPSASNAAAGSSLALSNLVDRAAATSQSGVGPIAHVPLFGTTAMTTMEPAPAASVASTIASVNPIAARELALAKMTSQLPVEAVVSEEPSRMPSEEPEPPAVKPEDVPPWGKGKVREPTLYRIKLDAPGEAIRGQSTARGFSVTVPGRKSLESPRGFAKRDSRIARVSANNASEGAKFVWQFNGEVPPYRVRFRKDAIEFLISAETPSKKSR